jgi:hypothetical protein
VPSEGDNCTLRRCTCVGMIGLRLFGVGPSISVFQDQEGHWRIVKEVRNPCQL